ncbi:hypothetical protein ACMFMG_009880 [Clarireedia jacksonii]
MEFEGQIIIKTNLVIRSLISYAGARNGAEISYSRLNKIFRSVFPCFLSFGRRVSKFGLNWTGKPYWKKEEMIVSHEGDLLYRDAERRSHQSAGQAAFMYHIISYYSS